MPFAWFFRSGWVYESRVLICFERDVAETIVSGAMERQDKAGSQDERILNV